MKKYLITKIILLFGLHGAFGLLHAQVTGTENYIQSVSYLDSTKVSDASKKRIETVQYFDGLGRPRQTVNVKTSPQGRDVVTHHEYDSFGRQVKDFLPVPQPATLNGGIVPNSLANATQPHIYGSEKIYAEKKFENSPLNRLQEQTKAGTAWSNKPVKHDYYANTVYDVRKYSTATNPAEGIFHSTLSVAGDAGSSGGYYKEGMLYKKKVSDEDGNTVYEYTSSQGQLLLERRILGPTENADTYYIYNEYDQLAYIIPPKAAELIKNLAPGTPVPDAVLNDLCYQYRYDSRYRVAEKKLPGKGWEFMVYDKQDRLILTQDAVLRTTTNNFNAKGWLFTKYDRFDRIVYTGFFSNTATRAAMQTAVNNMVSNAANNESRTDETPFSTQEAIVYYTKNAFPTGSMKILTINYYDTYPPGMVSVIPVSILGQKVLKQPGQGTVKNTNGFALASYIINIEEVGATTNYNWYDTKGRVIGTYSMNYLGGHTTTETEYDFGGAVKQTITKHRRSRIEAELQIKERFVYDGQNRLLKHYHQVDTNPEELLAENTYNEIGQLVNKKTGNTSGSPLQSVDYAYNIQGWLTKVNDPANLGDKFFAFELKYNNPADASYAPAKYNGNIAEFDWRTSTGNFLRRYAYKYDKLNRLLDASYREPFATAPVNDGFTEKLTYDLNGNIQTLKRYQPLANVPILIDDLNYQLYEGNRLKKVTDENTNPSGYPTGGNTIGYDLNGNMTDHLDKGITTISYNFLNLPKEVKFAEGNNNLQFLYRADGTKLKKSFTYFSSKSGLMFTNSTDYLDGFQYDKENGASPYLQFFPTSEGYYDYLKKRYIYNYKDHLGNIRLSYYQSVSVDAVVVDRETNYYPFGMEYEGFQGASSALQSYTYGYNGKERQKETGWNDYGARMYMPELGRWGVVDPASELGRSFSPYNYAFNNPIMFIDPDGMWPWPTWGQVKSFGRGAWNTTKAMARGAVEGASLQRAAIVGTVNLMRTYGAYKKGGIKAAARKAASIVYTETGAKDLVKTAKGVAKGDAESIGSATAMVIGVVVAHKAGAKGAVVSEAEATGSLSAAKLSRSQMGSISGAGSDANVVRGGTCLACQFENGSGVTVKDGLLEGVSVNSVPGLSIEELSTGIPNGKVGTTTVSEIEALGGKVKSSPTKNNPYHSTLSGITAEQAEKLFNPTIKNPTK